MIKDLFYRISWLLALVFSLVAIVLFAITKNTIYGISAIILMLIKQDLEKSV